MTSVVRASSNEQERAGLAIRHQFRTWYHCISAELGIAWPIPVLYQPDWNSPRKQERPMISKSKLGAIAFVAAIGFAFPATAQYGGGSPGYNAHNTTNYRLKRHHVKGRVSVKPHSWVKLKEKKSSQ